MKIGTKQGPSLSFFLHWIEKENKQKKNEQDSQQSENKGTRSRKASRPGGTALGLESGAYVHSN